MNKKIFTATIMALIVLVVPPLANVDMILANPVTGFPYPDYPIMALPILTIASPTQDGSYKNDSFVINFSLTKQGDTWFWHGNTPRSSQISNISYTLDGTCTVVFSCSIGEWDDGLGPTSNFSFGIGNLTEGRHVLEVDVAAFHFYGGWISWGEGFQVAENSASASVTFSVDDNPPIISNLSIENKTYNNNRVLLSFNVDEPVSEMSYSLDSSSNVTISSNETVISVPEGPHSIVVYVTDASGNVGKSGMVYFSVQISTPPPSPSPTQQPTPEPTTEPTPTPEANPLTNSIPYAIVGLAAVIIITVLACFLRLKRRKQLE